MAQEFLEDLVVQILLRLPAKSLIRFKCGCRSWCSLISNPSFISKNLLFSFNKNAHLLAKRRDNITKDQVFSLLSYDTFKLSVTRDLMYTEIDKEINIQIVGSPCNGIICLHDVYDYNTVLWNTTSNEIKVLPESHVPRPPDAFTFLIQTGFGFDVKNKDYKVVKFLVSWRNERFLQHQVEVYSLSNDSWREVYYFLDKFEVKPVPTYSGRTYTNGIFSWWAYGYFGVEHGEGIVSFDMSDEVFRTTPLPDASFIGSYIDNWRTFLSFNESISLVLSCSHDKVAPFSFEIWVLLEYGVKESWTKLFTIKPFPGVERPLGFGKKGELIMETSDGKLVLCNPTTQETSNLQIDGVPDTLQLVTYVETAAPINWRK